MTIDQLLKRHSDIMDTQEAVIRGKNDIIEIQKIQIDELTAEILELKRQLAFKDMQLEDLRSRHKDNSPF